MRLDFPHALILISLVGGMITAIILAHYGEAIIMVGIASLILDGLER